MDEGEVDRDAVVVSNQHPHIIMHHSNKCAQVLHTDVEGALN